MNLILSLSLKQYEIKRILKIKEKLFTDPFFQIDDSIFQTEKKIKWLSPQVKLNFYLLNNIISHKTINQEFNPTSFLEFESIDYKNIIQGSLDDCGLISACCSLSKYSFILKNVF